MQNRQENENSQALPQDVMKELKSFAAAVQKRVEKFPPESDLEKIKKQFAQAIFQEKRSRESFSEMFFNIIADIYIDNDKRLRQMQRLVAIASGIEAVNPPGKLPNLTEFKEKYPNLPIQSIMQYVNISHPFPSLMNT